MVWTRFLGCVDACRDVTVRGLRWFITRPTNADLAMCPSGGAADYGRVISSEEEKIAELGKQGLHRAVRQSCS